MQIRYLTLYTQIVKKLVNPADEVVSANLSLVIGTSNSLYKVINEGHADQGKINTLIIDTWLEVIEPVVLKMNELVSQIGNRAANPNDKSMYLRFELYENNLIAQYILQLYEQFDRSLIILESHLDRGFNQDKYTNIVSYFSEKIKGLVIFPYQQNKNLNKKLLYMNP